MSTVKVEVRTTVIVGYILLAIGAIMLIYTFAVATYDFYTFPIKEEMLGNEEIEIYTNLSRVIVKSVFLIIITLAGALLSKRGVSMILGRELAGP